MAVGRMTAESPARSTDSNMDRDDLLEAYLKDATLQGLTDRTLATYRSDLQYFLDWLETDPRTIDRRDLTNFLYNLKNERTARDGSVGLASSTLNSYFAAINSFCKYLKYDGEVEENLIPEFRDRYLDVTGSDTGSERQLISLEEMAMLVHATLNVRNRAIILVLAKTGVRRNELIQIDRAHIEWETQLIRLQPTPKRTNTLVFFDGECLRVLERWLRARDEEDPNTDALFTNQYGDRLQRNGVYEAVTSHAEAVDLHDPDSSDLQDRFTPHCCRHWFTTHPSN